MTRAALVTGAAGFIGSTLATMLVRAGVRVHGIDRSEAPPPLRPYVSWTSADLSAEIPASVEIPPEVFHCAGSGVVGASFDDPAGDFTANVATTARLLERVASRPETRVVLVSSAAVYGSQAVLPIKEDAPLAPASPYGEHKRQAEELLRQYARKVGLNGVIVRLFSIYGPGLRKQLLWDACSKFWAGTPVFGGDGTEVRDWLHVRDAVALLDLAAKHATPACPVYNGGTGTGTTVRDVLELLARRLGKAEPPRFSGRARRGDPAALVADIGAARALGWSPVMPLADGLAEYADWFMSVQQ